MVRYDSAYALQGSVLQLLTVDGRIFRNLQLEVHCRPF